MDGSEFGSGNIPRRGIPGSGYAVGPSPELVKAGAGGIQVVRGGIKYPNGPVPKPGMVPYGTTGSGHAGNDTSRERQETEDALGTTAWRQAQALQMITEAKSAGVTVMEYEAEFGLHHGQASSALSHLHRAGHVARLKMRRSKQEIYVLPGFINGRDESPYRPREGRKHPRFVSDEAVVHAMNGAGFENIPSNFALIRKFLELLP